MWLTISNALIIISAIFTLVWVQQMELSSIFGMSHLFLLQGDYLRLAIQFCMYSFLHWGILHLLFNSIFLYFFWNQLESKIWKKWFLFFFLWTTLFNGIALLIFTQVGTVTIWISGFALAILSFYTLLLYERKDAEYKWWITALIINILIGLSAQVSFIGHLFGAIFWGIFYVIYRLFTKR